MTDTSPSAPTSVQTGGPDAGILLNKDARSDWVRLNTLLTLRWLAVAGQLGAVLIGYFLFALDIPLQLTLFVILLAVCFNLVTQLILPDTRRLSESATALMLLFDLMQLAALLALTGGIANPFVMLITAPVVISATALTLRATVALGLVTLMFSTLLAIVHVPLSFQNGEVLTVPPLYILGMWTAVLISTVFLALYARRVTAESFSMNQALLATQMALSREQRLSALGGVVAATAHELGTPLATIKLTASELVDELRDLDVPDYLCEDAALIRDQTDRCREILRGMGRAGKDDKHLRYGPISSVVREAAEPHSERGKQVVIRLNGADEADVGGDQPLVLRTAEFLHGLRNLIQNAVDFASTTVWIDVTWSETTLRIVVGDDGPGYPPDLMARLGDPFVRRRSGAPVDPQRPGYEGMGLGLFIAKTLLERSGAALTFANGRETAWRPRPVETQADAGRSRPLGAVVECAWPRRRIEADRAVARGALGENIQVS
ncbi:MAG: ActS/PrrB/RegB family redox-sensitive histidine kinase [Pseudomonadota bacterium]